MKIHEPPNILEEELRIRKQLNNILKTRILNNEIHIKQLEKQMEEQNEKK